MAGTHAGMFYNNVLLGTRATFPSRAGVLVLLPYCVARVIPSCNWYVCTYMLVLYLV